VAPEQRLPRAATDLTGVIRDGTVELRWLNPGRRVDNSRLGDLALARVFRSEDGGAGEPRPALLVGDRIAGYREVATIRLAEPAPATVEGERVVLRDREGLTPGRRYTYVVVAVDAHRRASAPSSRLALTFIAAPGPPEGVAGEAGEDEARLRWKPPPRLVDGSAAGGGLSYEVLRAPAADAPLVAVARTRAGETEAVDRNVQNDLTYYYAVRAVRTEAGSTAIGEASPRVAVTPVDMTPPSPPNDLVAIPSAGAVRLSWRPSPEADVRAYVVYRAGEGADFVRVGSARPPATVFVDRDVPRGNYRYAVTAQDAGARANESARSNVVAVTVP
jgi:fibronectin type 3 domain-containing protein